MDLWQPTANNYWKLEDKDFGTAANPQACFIPSSSASTKHTFSLSRALATLLFEEHIFVAEAEGTNLIKLYANCNDIFLWGYVDAQEFHIDELEEIFTYYATDTKWGIAFWCCKKRNQLPQLPVQQAMEARGWSFATLSKTISKDE